MNSFALITAIALAADFCRRIDRAGKDNDGLAQVADRACSLRHRHEFHRLELCRRVHRPSRQALPRDAFAELVERLVDNGAIAQKFRALGFTSVRVSGSGATRKVEGVWPGKDMSTNMPRQIVAVAKL
jgi:hypothetical protein